MRIRKHAKISFQHGTVCQLNQSPWDIITFSPPQKNSFPPPHPPPPPPLHHQGFYLNNNSLEEEEEEDSLLGNGSFADSIRAEESVASRKLSFNDNNSSKKIIEAEVEEEEEMFCSKIDSKGWQCHRIAKSGHTFCEHHLSSKAKKYNNGSNNLARESCAKESDKYVEHTGHRGRAKKGLDPNGYYYYSGFGPRWGKRRGAKFSTCNDNDNNGSVGNGDEGGEVLGVSSRIGYGELDYMEEEGEDEGSGSGSGKKRARKPIKARSLKSLM